MAAVTCESTVDKMKQKHNNTLGWDVVVNYGEREINALLDAAYRKAREEEEQKREKKSNKHHRDDSEDEEEEDRDPPKAISSISCGVQDEDDNGDDCMIVYKFELGPPKITFKSTDHGPLCTLTIPVIGGGAKKGNDSPQQIYGGTYELVFDNLGLGMANVEDRYSYYTGSDFTFAFPPDENTAIRAGVVINLPASDPAVTINTPNDRNKVALVDDHKSDVEAAIKDSLKTTYGEVRFELAHLSSAKPPDDTDHEYIQLRPKAFRISVYNPSSSGNQDSILSLFIVTRDTIKGEQENLFSEWNKLWKTTHQCAPIPSWYTASIIFNKDMIFKTVIEPTVKKQGFTVSMDNTDGGITLSIDTKKQVHRDADDRVEKLGDGSTNEYKVSAIDKTPGNLRVTLNEDSSHQAQCLGSWKFDYHFTWSFYHDDRYAGMGGRSYGSNGGITATHTLDKKLALCTFVDQYKLHIDCPISASDWSVDFVGDDKNWWEQFCGGTKTIPDWVKNLSVQMPTFTLHLGSLYFFLTTNLLLPSQQVITVDTRTGIQIPGDLYLVGFVDDRR